MPSGVYFHIEHFSDETVYRTIRLKPSKALNPEQEISLLMEQALNLSPAVSYEVRRAGKIFAVAESKVAAELVKVSLERTLRWSDLSIQPSSIQLPK